MSHVLIHGLEQYGYLALFFFVFMQEVGFPSPLPNEYVLLFSGYLSSTGMLNLGWVIVVVIGADLLAGWLLYELFFRAGAFLITKQSSWMRVPYVRMMVLKNRLQRSGRWGVVVGRLSPFIRGWVAVICGLLHMPRSVYSNVLLGTSCIWTMAYVGVGFLIGPHFQLIYSQNKTLGVLLVILPLVALILFHVVRAPFSIDKKVKKQLKSVSL